MPARKGWMRYRDLPEELVEGMPEHIRATFVAARLHRFDVEMLCSGGTVSRRQRARRRFVLVADDLARSCAGGPLNFDLEALAEDVRAVPRIFVISTARNAEIYAAAYQSAIEDLKSGHDVALVVETRPMFARSWARTLAAIQRGCVPTPSKSGRKGHIIRGHLPSA
jgi:cation transport regulator ChaB